MKDDQSHKVIPVLESSFVIYEPVIQNILQPIRRIKQYFSLARKISSNEYCLIKSASLNKLSSGFHQKTKSGGILQKKINHPTIPKIYYLIESRNSFYICSKR